MDIRKLQRAIVDGLEDVKAQDIVVFNTEHLTSMFERVIVASGTSNRQTKALAAGVRDAVKASGFPVLRTEGESNGEWIIVDCGAAVAHIMQPEIRRYYHLEEIWGDKPVKVKLGAVKGLVKAASAQDEDDDLPPKGRGGARKTAGDAATTSAAKKTAAKKAGAKTVAGKAAASKTAGRASAKSAALKQRTAAAPARKAAAKKTSTARASRAEAAPPAVPVRRIAAKKPSAKSATAAKKAPAKKAARRA